MEWEHLFVVLAVPQLEVEMILVLVVGPLLPPSLLQHLPSFVYEQKQKRHLQKSVGYIF